MALSSTQLRCIRSTLSGARSNRCTPRAVTCQAFKPAMGSAAAAVAAALLISGQPAHAVSWNELQSLSYKEVKGSGLANTCPEIYDGESASALKPGQYRMERFCMEPTSFQVKEDIGKGREEFVRTKLLTRLTYTLDQMEGRLTVGADGKVQLKEEDGIDYAPVTVSLPGGEYIPLMFTVKQLDAKGTPDLMTGTFTVPSYRGATFMDPKGRGGASGYESAVGLYGAQDKEEITRTNNKTHFARQGEAAFIISSVDPVTGEVAGVFETLQPADDDMGAKDSKEVKITGVWYTQLTTLG
mmetsp:Transcript_13310/g.32520  ORF Transcript_13310/g.32520 Transcript_13310/m.32520 type:complete len:298 (-) Transcript_13310:501-1394(-)